MRPLMLSVLFLSAMGAAAFADPISFGDELIISANADQAIDACAADLDGDGDNDVVSVSAGDQKLAWYANTDGLGTFGPQIIITTAADYAFRVSAADLDGQARFGPQHVISTQGQFPHCIRAADLDRDSDLDVLTTSWGDDKVAWFRNELHSSVVEPERASDSLRGDLRLRGTPNPIFTETMIFYELCATCRSAACIFDAQGRLIRTLLHPELQSGPHTLIWDGTDRDGRRVGGGIYHCRLEIDEHCDTLLLVLAR